METSFSDLHSKEVVNVLDGKRLGRVCDVVFSYPEGRVSGIVAPGGRGLRWWRAEVFIELRCVKKIGVDVVLVELRTAPKPAKRGKWCAGKEPPYAPPPDRRDYGEYE